jgi:arylsulfatase A-like enzyme
MSAKARRAAVGALLLVATIAGACREHGDAAERIDGRGRSLQGAVLIVLDTVRAGHLSAYGHERRTSPSLDRLAQEGVLFEQVVSFAPWTLPSVATILSGRPAGEVYVDGHLRESIVERVRAAGYRTAAVTEGGWFSKAFGFDLGFADYVEEEGAVQWREPGRGRDREPTGGIESTFGIARRWLSAHRDDRFFLVIHTYEPHAPYRRRTFAAGQTSESIGDVFRLEMMPELKSGRIRLGDEDLAYLAALYDGGILESDRHVGALLVFLETVGLRDRTLVVVTSDHGEELGDHYRTHAGDHGHALLDDQLLVPLILHNPVEAYPVRRVTAQVRTMDILPTIAEILGVVPGADLAGSSLVPMMRGEERGGRLAVGGDTKSGPRRAFLRDRGYKYIAVLGPHEEGRPLPFEPPADQLYDLRADPGERSNLASERPELAREFREILAGLGGGPDGARVLPDRLDPEQIDRLRSLGYLD